jgi:Putative Ig domain
MSERKPIRFKLIIEGETMSQETINFSLAVNPATPPPPALVVVDGNGNPLSDGSSVTLQAEMVGVADPGQVLFKVSGGTAPYSYQVTEGALPAGDSLNATENSDGSETVELSGTPTAAGNASFSVQVSDSAGATAQVSVRKAIK